MKFIGAAPMLIIHVVNKNHKLGKNRNLSYIADLPFCWPPGDTEYTSWYNSSK